MRVVIKNHKKKILFLFFFIHKLSYKQVIIHWNASNTLSDFFIFILIRLKTLKLWFSCNMIKIHLNSTMIQMSSSSGTTHRFYSKDFWINWTPIIFHSLFFYAQKNFVYLVRSHKHLEMENHFLLQKGFVVLIIPWKQVIKSIKIVLSLQKQLSQFFRCL